MSLTCEATLAGQVCGDGVRGEGAETHLGRNSRAAISGRGGALPVRRLGLRGLPDVLSGESCTPELQAAAAGVWELHATETTMSQCVRGMRQAGIGIASDIGLELKLEYIGLEWIAFDCHQQ